MPTDEEIKQKIEQELKWDIRVNSPDIKVIVENGNVTLEGSVPSHWAKSAAYENAVLIEGVGSITDNLNVKYVGKHPTDEELRNRIENKLEWNPDVDPSNIDVIAESGIITLKGTVGTFWEKMISEDEAENTTGVYEVINELAVTPKKKVSDEQIAQDIVESYERSPTIDTKSIDVRVEDGKVVLSGTASSWAEKADAVDNAYYTFGVREVDADNLEVEPDGSIDEG